MKGSWARFTLMDGTSLVVAAALGMSKASSLGRFFDPAGGPVPWVVSAVLCSGVLACPLVLVSQAIRGRRSMPGLGEWFWLIPPGLFVPLLALKPGTQAHLAHTLGAIEMQCLLSVIALGCLVARFLAPRPHVTCRWTDILGLAVCAAVGPGIFVVLMLSPLRLP